MRMDERTLQAGTLHDRTAILRTRGRNALKLICCSSVGDIKFFQFVLDAFAYEMSALIMDPVSRALWRKVLQNTFDISLFQRPSADTNLVALGKDVDDFWLELQNLNSIFRGTLYVESRKPCMADSSLAGGPARLCGARI